MTTMEEVINLWLSIDIANDEYLPWIRAEIEKAGLNPKLRFIDMSPEELEIHAKLLRQWKETH